jgi:hypothetical protein
MHEGPVDQLPGLVLQVVSPRELHPRLANIDIKARD